LGQATGKGQTGWREADERLPAVREGVTGTNRALWQTDNNAENRDFGTLPTRHLLAAETAIEHTGKALAKH
jgi:hypothetical protein